MVYLQIFMVVFAAVFWVIFGIPVINKFLDMESDLRKKKNEFLNSSFLE